MRRRTSAFCLIATTTAFLVLNAPPAAASTTTHEQGYAISCTAEGPSGSAFIDLYTNNTVSVPAVIVLEGPQQTLVSADDTKSARIDKGKIRAQAHMVDLETKAPAGKAKVRGTYTVDGAITAVNDAFSDAGEHVVVTGTNQALSTDVELRIGRQKYPLTCGTAFRFDLTVTRTPIG